MDRLARPFGSIGPLAADRIDEEDRVEDQTDVIGPFQRAGRHQVPEEAAGHFGRLGHFLGINRQASSEQMDEQLGWGPRQPALIPISTGRLFLQLDRPRT